MKKEASKTYVVDEEGIELSEKNFHDEFDALEWAEKNLEKGTHISIMTERRIVL